MFLPYSSCWKYSFTLRQFLAPVPTRPYSSPCILISTVASALSRPPKNHFLEAFEDQIDLEPLTLNQSEAQHRALICRLVPGDVNFIFWRRLFLLSY